MPVLLILVIVASASFDVLNGLRDASGFVSTIIASRALSPRLALLIAAVAEFFGPFIFGVAVANTFGKTLVDPGMMSLRVILPALLTALVWNVATLWLRLPSSSSHALIGGLIGAVGATMGFTFLRTGGLVKVFAALMISPLLGIGLSYLTTKLVYFAAGNATPRINVWFKRMQIITLIAQAMSYGANDAQKTMGVVSLGLLSGGYMAVFAVPMWVMALSSGAIAIGIAAGGWRMIRAVGGGFYKIRPVNGFCSQISATIVILGAGLLGGPVSSTQVATTSILGAGAAERFNKVRWGTARHILTAWVLTIPLCILLGAGLAWMIEGILR